MARLAPRPCTFPGCGALTTTGRCHLHRGAERRDHDRGRASSSDRGYDGAWRRARAGFLRAHPLCQCPECDEGRIRARAAVVVDHKRPHRGDRELFWDQGNWQAMAKDCHDRKTATEDGGFGNCVQTSGQGDEGLA